MCKDGARPRSTCPITAAGNHKIDPSGPPGTLTALYLSRPRLPCFDAGKMVCGRFANASSARTPCTLDGLVCPAFQFSLLGRSPLHPFLLSVTSWARSAPGILSHLIFSTAHISLFLSTHVSLFFLYALLSSRYIFIPLHTVSMLIRTDRTQLFCLLGAARSSQDCHHHLRTPSVVHECHDFLLASRHIRTGRASADVATKYSMPAGMWQPAVGKDAI